jgi:hypothetical protein
VQLLAGSRVEIRLDNEHRDKLARIVQTRGSTVSVVMRSLIDDAERRGKSDDLKQTLRRLQQSATWAPTEDEIQALSNEVSLGISDDDERAS